MIEIGTIVTINRFKDVCEEYKTLPARKNKRRLKNKYLMVIACLKEEKRQKHISDEEYDTYINTITTMFNNTKELNNE